MPRRGSLVHLVDQLLDRVLAVADDVARHALGDRDQLAVDHQHAVVVAGDEALDDDAPAVLPGDVEGGAHLLGGREVDRDAAAVVGVERLHHHRVADPLRRGHRVVGALHQPLRGTGRPRLPRMRLVSSLSEASSTAMCGCGW